MVVAELDERALQPHLAMLVEIRMVQKSDDVHRDVTALIYLPTNFDSLPG